MKEKNYNNFNFIKNKENKTKNNIHYKNNNYNNYNKNPQSKFLEKKRKHNSDYINYKEYKGTKPLSNYQNNKYTSPTKSKLDFKAKTPIKKFDFDKNKKIRNNNINNFYFYKKYISMIFVRRKNYKYENNKIIPCLSFN